jgi:hypothetical protein
MSWTIQESHFGFDLGWTKLVLRELVMELSSIQILNNDTNLQDLCQGQHLHHVGFLSHWFHFARTKAAVDGVVDVNEMIRS